MKVDFYRTKVSDFNQICTIFAPEKVNVRLNNQASTSKGDVKLPAQL